MLDALTSYMLLTPQCVRNSFSLGCAITSFWGTQVTTCTIRHITLWDYTQQRLRSVSRISQLHAFEHWPSSHLKREARWDRCMHSGQWLRSQITEVNEVPTFVLFPTFNPAIAASSGISRGDSRHSTLHGNSASASAITSLCSLPACTESA